jgi:hypothetical protein
MTVADWRRYYRILALIDRMETRALRIAGLTQSFEDALREGQRRCVGIHARPTPATLDRAHAGTGRGDHSELGRCYCIGSRAARIPVNVTNVD